jgi:ribosome-binding factor A
MADLSTRAAVAGSDRNRAARVAEAIRGELADLVAREVKDPRVQSGLITVSHVEVNRDLSVAEVGVSILAGEPRAVMKGLEGAARFLRGPLARRLRLRVAPELRFHHDTSQEMTSRLRDIVREDEVRRAEADGTGEADDSAEPEIEAGDDGEDGKDGEDAQQLEERRD